MEFFTTLIVLSLSFSLMAIGLIFSRKALRRGCSIDPDACACLSGRQACLKEGKSPEECDK